QGLITRIGPTPLAVELASAWTRALSVAELNERLEQKPELLTDAPGLAPLTARSIDVTRGLMSGGEREALGTLATAPAGFTAAIAERYKGGLVDPQGARLRVARAFSEAAARIEEMSGQERSTHGYRQMDVERANLLFALRELAEAGEEERVWPLVRTLRGYLD